MAIKRTKTKITDVEVVPVFEYYAKNNQTEGERKLVGAQLLDFCRMTGTTHIVARNTAFPEGHPNWSQFVIVDIKKLEEEIEGRIDLEKLVSQEKEKKYIADQARKAKNPKRSDLEAQIAEEIRKGAEDAHKESTDGEK